MTPGVTSVALLLLLLPPSSHPIILKSDFVAKQVFKLAVERELADPREISQFFQNPDEYASDVGVLQIRYQSLKNAPTLWYSGVFPQDICMIDQQKSMNKEYDRFIDSQTDFLKISWVRNNKIKQENLRLYEIYDTLRDAKCAYYYVHVRRTALMKLREALGYEDFYEGRLPPPVPLWRFTRN